MLCLVGIASLAVAFLCVGVEGDLYALAIKEEYLLVRNFGCEAGIGVVSESIAFGVSVLVLDRVSTIELTEITQKLEQLRIGDVQWQVFEINS